MDGWKQAPLGVGWGGCSHSLLMQAVLGFPFLGLMTESTPHLQKIEVFSLLVKWLHVAVLITFINSWLVHNLSEHLTALFPCGTESTEIRSNQK